MGDGTPAFEGVAKCDAIQAGSALRVIVDTTHIMMERKLAFEMSKMKNKM